MATVFAATHPLIGKKVAIKVISRRLCADQHAVERFIHEARTVNQIGHPNIVDIFAFGVLPDGRAYFVMEWLQGETLGERLAAAGACRCRARSTSSADRRRARGRARKGHRPPRSQAGQHLRRRARRQDARSSCSTSASPSSPTRTPACRRRARAWRSARRLHVAGAGARQERRSPHRHLRARLRRLRDAARAAAVRRRHGDRHPGDAPGVGAAGAAHAVADDAGGLEKILLQMLSKEPDGRPSLMQVRALFDAASRSITPTMGVAVGPRPVVERPWTVVAGGRRDRRRS